MQEYTIHPNRLRLLALILIMTGLIAYSNSYTGLFVFDDEYTLEEFDPGEGLFTQTRNFFFREGAPACGRPPVSFSLAINHTLHGKDLWGYHAMNVAIHIGAGLILFGVIRRTLLRKGVVEEHALYLAFFTALIWIAHPINSSSVTYIAQRAESIMGLLFVLTFYFIVREKWIAAVITCWICVAAKEVGAMIPFVFLFYDRAFISRTWRQCFQDHKWVYAGFIASWIVIPLLLSTGPKGNTVQFVYQIINPFTYLMTQCNAIVMYIKLMIWPHPLVLDYGWPIANRLPEYWLSLCIVLGLFGSTIFLVLRRPTIGFLGASFFMILAPTSSVLPIITEIMAEHRMYTPAMIIVAYAVFGIYILAQRRQWLRPACGLALLVTGACTALTIRQNYLYHDKVALWSYNSTHTPYNRRSWYNLGVAWDAKGQRATAIPAYLNAIKCSPDWESPHRNVASAYMELGDYDRAEKHFNFALEYEPKEVDNYLFMGQLQFFKGNYDKGFRMFQAAMDLSPGLPRTHKGFALGYLMVDDVNSALQHIVNFIGATEINAEVIQSAMQMSNDLGKPALAQHIQNIAIQQKILAPPSPPRAPSSPQK